MSSENDPLPYETKLATLEVAPFREERMGDYSADFKKLLQLSRNKKLTKLHLQNLFEKVTHLESEVGAVRVVAALRVQLEMIGVSIDALPRPKFEYEVAFYRYYQSGKTRRDWDVGFPLEYESHIPALVALAKKKKLKKSDLEVVFQEIRADIIQKEIEKLLNPEPPDTDNPFAPPVKTRDQLDQGYLERIYEKARQQAENFIREVQNLLIIDDGIRRRIRQLLGLDFRINIENLPD